MATPQPHADMCIRRTTTISVFLVAAIAAVVSYRHMYNLECAHGETSWTAALLPLSVDGMIVTSSMSLLQASRNGSRGVWLSWTLLAVWRESSAGRPQPHSLRLSSSEAGLCPPLPRSTRFARNTLIRLTDRCLPKHALHTVDLGP
ncbi:DUF2637 domain-containing protein [Streptosporangium sp. NPDC087985]|uniref:DUF2637 domain-containing protein n=1 Tax=Streptosporangium sp. NPDC087985 TaxID=3366196 RepID=UPI0038004C9A